MQRPVDELAALVRAGELSALELVKSSLRRIDALDRTVNAFVDVDHVRALQAAAWIEPGDERPFAGVPIAIKNNRAVRGLRLTRGADLAGDVVAEHDHNVVRRLREAGFIIVGTTTMPEWGILPVTEPRRFGPARNPWDLERTPGGSSGGSAAAVAAGMVPIAHGNDGGGSLRIPAACCGLVGLKPSRGRISPAPDAGESFLLQDGVLTRSVRETALLLDVLAGPEPGDASWAPPPPEPFARAAAREPGRLRIALTTISPLEARLDPECERSARDAAALLAGLGHDVYEVPPPWRRPATLKRFTACFGPAVCVGIADAARVAGREPREDDMEPLSWWLWRSCSEMGAIHVALAELELQAFAREIVTWAAPYDAIVTPALAQSPLHHGALDTSAEDPAATFRRSGEFTPFTAICNVTGQPAISLPLYVREDGLPLAVQLIGRPAGEGPLLALASQLERALAWSGRRPALAAG